MPPSHHRLLALEQESKSITDFISSEVRPNHFCDYLRQGGDMHVADVVKAKGWDKLGSAELLERVDQMARCQASADGTLGAVDRKYDWPAKPWEKKGVRREPPVYSSCSSKGHLVHARVFGWGLHTRHALSMMQAALRPQLSGRAT